MSAGSAAQGTRSCAACHTFPIDGLSDGLSPITKVMNENSIHRTISFPFPQPSAYLGTRHAGLKRLCEARKGRKKKLQRTFGGEIRSKAAVVGPRVGGALLQKMTRSFDQDVSMPGSL